MEIRRLTSEANKALKLFDQMLSTFNPRSEELKREYLRIAIMAAISDAYSLGQLEAPYGRDATITLPPASD